MVIVQNPMELSPPEAGKFTGSLGHGCLFLLCPPLSS